MSPREKCIKLLLLVLSKPYVFTRKELAKRLNMSRDAVDECVSIFKALDIGYNQDGYKCAILPDRNHPELKRLLPLTVEEQNIIRKSLLEYQLRDEEKSRIMTKIATLYDFQKLGLRALRKPELDKIELLEKAIKIKKQVRLVSYRSNSNDIRDRDVDCFFINTKAGMIQAYDSKKEDVRHFKLNRMKRVEILEPSWHRKKYDQKATDVFRIADNNQEPIHLILNVYAYNSMMDSFPASIEFMIERADGISFDFATHVNHKFRGLVPFIMSNPGQVKIMSPELLKQAVKDRVEKVMNNELLDSAID